MFRVGQQVICINDKNPLTDLPGFGGLVIGTTYTITSVGAPRGWYGPKEATYAVYVKEIHRPMAGFANVRFRPLVEVEKPTDIAIFRKILDEVNAGIHRDIKEDA